MVTAFTGKKPEAHSNWAALRGHPAARGAGRPEIQSPRPEHMVCSWFMSTAHCRLHGRDIGCVDGISASWCLAS